MPRTINWPIFIGILCAIFFILVSFLIYGLFPINTQGTPITFEVRYGDGFREIVDNLYVAGLIRSPIAFESIAVLSGSADHLKPGSYQLSPAMSVLEILRTITGGSREVAVSIPEGSTIYDIDRILSNALVIQPGDLVSATSTLGLEGKLFPDTYNFFTYSNASAVIQKFLNNFNAKAKLLLAGDEKNASRDLIIASIIQKEITGSNDQMLVTGIIEKRLAAGMPLNIDATICYIKQQEHPILIASCYPLTSADFKVDSPYNTYLYQGLPPTPIGNPGVAAIQAALHPKQSPYWYYLSDPKTGKTIYAATLDEQTANRSKYFGQ